MSAEQVLWHPVKDRLPAYGQTVLFTDVKSTTGWIRIGYLEKTDRNGHQWHVSDTNNGIHFSITHWADLPQMPKL